MLYSLGPVELRLAPLNPTRTQNSARYPFAEHDVLGAPPAYEDMGDGERKFSLSCITFPNDDLFAGGLTSIAALEVARSSAVPQLFLRGDGLLLGFYLIEGLRETGETLDWVGVPGAVELEIDLLRSDAPFADSIFNLFGGAL
ncbi:phage tail protein [Ancylobacter polymorphus]|uniref:Phage protein U n=1 Tax=Ancylobacter polymorphus TaxID=223390 RepID=A0ABU0B7K3_9HYPH|nr:phage tail protein [Ancylobacter polymorphus]MDQ0301346.1 phage protein U [Ancylobacter polymorphus]